MKSALIVVALLLVLGLMAGCDEALIANTAKELLAAQAAGTGSPGSFCAALGTCPSDTGSACSGAACEPGGGQTCVNAPCSGPIDCDPAPCGPGQFGLRAGSASGTTSPMFGQRTGISGR